MKSSLFYNIARVAVALLFIFSGVAKSLNPFGLSIQIGDYLAAMGLDFLMDLKMVAAVVLPSFELLLGLMLLVGVFRKLTIMLIFTMMSFFTVLTLWIAIANPVSDCGCFGDLLKISNWETFIKNILFMVPTTYLLLQRNRPSRNRTRLLIALVPLSCALSIYTLFTIPLIDATPYKIGVNIAQQMQIPDGAEVDQGHTVLIYKNLKDDSLKEFEIDDPTWQDTLSWEFVDSRTEILKKGYTPEIKSLPMIDHNGDRSAEILSREGLQLIIATNDARQLDLAQIERLAANIPVVILCSGPIGVQISGVEVLNSDSSVIKTLIQHHRGGALLLKDGTIQAKWAMRRIPEKLDY